ncbi:glycerol kinase GlpK [Lichenihabitans sp. Uapishka_5]|uniref:glycerol kinase GlpK n=1 Tax=Lichenihabitans sp. Uapishka_5 TaxID=3037302 RepID=UPI0029E8128E|nr:glycerol kinase GlpK [Lichenihabitans sp. Uapishka_5]MDX7952742.1 glycerol kinase GlpK [Lichenihabitans sp. Uapishka_5]
MPAAILVIDQGTTSTRAIVFGPDALPIATAQEEFPQSYPHPGWVEHDPKDLWRTTVSTARLALAKVADQGITVAALGITNQRETALIWDRKTGAPIYNAIVWQDRRTAAFCAQLKQDGAEPLVQRKAGLLLDPYFSATKINWLLDTVEGARARAERGELAFGTIDSYLLWRFTEGRVHATDATNACRTALYDIHAGDWDDDLLKLFRVPRSLLPTVMDCAAEFGTTAPDLLGIALPVRGIAGDQQAALIGQACFRPGMVKATFGTGAFVLLNTGDAPKASTHRLLTTVGYQLKGRRTYALEGAIFAAGATVQWLRDGLGLVRSSAETGQLAALSDQDQPVYLVPAFVGLGAPIWDADARGTVIGITRGTTRREIARAALESTAFQTRDLVEAMRADFGAGEAGAEVIRADGGMSASDWTMQSVADMIDAPVDRPVVRETTALGAGYLAGLQSGLYGEPDDFAKSWHLDRRFEPAMPADTRAAKLAGWRDAIARTVSTPR